MAHRFDDIARALGSDGPLSRRKILYALGVAVAGAVATGYPAEAAPKTGKKCTKDNNCASGQRCCNGICTNITTTSNCGRCGNVCSNSQGCCNGICKPLNTVDNCGTCNVVCISNGGKAECCAGKCTDVTKDPANCATCGNKCAGVCCLTTANPKGECCAAGQICCTNFTGFTVCCTPGKNCDPGNVCNPDFIFCSSGSTVTTAATLAGEPCTAGPNCCNGQCIDITTDPNNCGACGNKCASGTTCTAGTCTCPTGQTLCAGVCVSTSCPTNQTFNTTTCTCQCAPITCASGATQDPKTCQCVCPTGQIICNGACVNVASDINNCGSCGHACPSGAVCTSGTCSGGCGPTDEGATCTYSGGPRDCGVCRSGVCVCGQFLTGCPPCA
jgi:hypothetical protein